MPKKYTSEIQEVLEVVHFIKDHAATQESVDNLDKRVDGLDKRLTRVEALMVTKDYLDDKLADSVSDIFSRLDKRYKKDNQFKTKVVELFKKHKIGTPEELAFLKGLVEGSY